MRAGAGSARDSLSVLDQLLGGAGPDGVTYDVATNLLGYTPDTLLDEVVDAFAAGDGAGVFGVVDKVIETGQDPRRFTEDLLRRLRDLVIVAAVPDAPASGLIDAPEDQAERLVAQAARFGKAELIRAADIVAAGLTEMRGATDAAAAARADLRPGAAARRSTTTPLGLDGPARSARAARVGRPAGTPSGSARCAAAASAVQRRGAAPATPARPSRREPTPDSRRSLRPSRAGAPSPAPARSPSRPRSRSSPRPQPSRPSRPVARALPGRRTPDLARPARGRSRRCGGSPGSCSARTPR